MNNTELSKYNLKRALPLINGFIKELVAIFCSRNSIYFRWVIIKWCPILSLEKLISTVQHRTLALNNPTSILIGSNDSTPLSPFDVDGFYINTARPAPSNGTITTLNYCYYGRRDNSKDLYQSLIALYRPAIRSSYERVSDTIIVSKLPPTSTVPQTDVLMRGFNCDYYELQGSLQVLEGDVLGACIFDTSRIGQLDLISFTREGYTFLRDGANNVDCDRGVLPLEIGGDTLERTIRRGILHVSAGICKSLVYTGADLIMEYHVCNCWHSHSSRYSNYGRNGHQQSWYMATGCTDRPRNINKAFNRAAHFSR